MIALRPPRPLRPARALVLGVAFLLAAACGAPRAAQPRPAPRRHASPHAAPRPHEVSHRLTRHGATHAPRRARRVPKSAWTTRLDRALNAASPAGRQVLEAARRMMSRQEIVIGSCWDYANAVFKRAGHPNRRDRRQTIFKGARKTRQFARARLIKPGDWLYYVNHDYREVPHSAIFVAWLDRRRKRALMITYRGARRAVPGVLDDYTLTSVYRIVRPVTR